MDTAVATREREEKPAEEVVLHSLQDSYVTIIPFEQLFKGSGLWDESLNKVATFSSVEHFWSVLLHTSPPSRIDNGTDVYMFREEIEPRWEHPKNENGGRWLLNLPSDAPIDTYWEELLMLLVGCDWDTDKEAEQICGAVFQPRARGHKMAVWLSDGEDEDTILKIGRRVKERLNFPDKMYFHTVPEQKTLARGKDVTTGRYVI